MLTPFQGQFVVPYGNDGVYTRFPMRKPRVTFAKPGQDPIVHINFFHEGKLVRLVVLHPRPPVKPLWYQRHRAHFARLEKEIGNEHTPLIVVGDLNTSPWSATFQHFLKSSGLQDSQQGFGLQPSWPTYIPKLNMPLRLFNVTVPVTVIPIDHVLLSPDWAVLNRKTGLDIGSDHLPVIIQLQLTKG